MAIQLLVIAVIILACVLCNRLSSKLGMPMLLAFIALGMFFGSDGAVKIAFEDFALAETICSIALIFIMFYGGFGTSWEEAKPVSVQAGVLSTLGVILTAVLTGAFCHLALGISWLEGLLIGSVLGSTDAASVFSILRSKKLSLKYGTSSLLEMESGSNDPCAYMLTVIVLSVMSGTGSVGQIVYMVFAQVVYGVAAGAALAFGALWVLRHFKFATDGFDSAFVLAVAVISYALPAVIGGNGYLSAYIVGIILGNSKFPHRKNMVHFFDGLTGLMQMLIFFLLGLLAFPSQMPAILLPSLLIALFLTLVARPAAVFLLLAPFKAKLSQKLVVSWAGLRGAASIVFAIVATVSPAYTKHDVFHIAFCVVLFSIALQGSLLPLVAKKAGLIDENGDVLKTFSDYAKETEVLFFRLEVYPKHSWVGRKVRDIHFPPGTMLALLKRGDRLISPRGGTDIRAGDILVMSAPEYRDDGTIRLSELVIGKNHEWCGEKLSDLPLPKGDLIVLIKRGDRTVIPNGKVTIKPDDVLVFHAGAN